LNSFPTTHEVKCWPSYFEAIKYGDKTFDIRKADRKYAVGNILVLREWDPDRGRYTGQEIRKKITYVLREGSIPPLHGLRPGYVVLSLADVTPAVRNVPVSPGAEPGSGSTVL
jgi:hypothetical protein